jgi:hypothetical protein
MSFTPKPFNWSESLYALIFSGRPAYFNALDLDKQFQIVQNATSLNAGMLGICTDVVLSVTGFIKTSGGGNDTYGFTFSATAGEIWVGGTKLFPAAVVNQIESFTMATPGGSPLPVPPAFYFCVVATQVGLNFGSNPTICGLGATEYPSLVPSCEATQYQNVSIVCTLDPSTLANMVGVLYTYTPRVDAATGTLVYDLFNNCIDFTDAPAFIGSPAYHAGTFQTNPGLVQKFNDSDRRYAKLYDPNYFQNTQNILATAGLATFNGTSGVVTLPAGNAHLVDIGAASVINGIVPDPSMRSGTIIYLSVTTTQPSIVFTGIFFGEFIPSATILSSDMIVLQYILIGTAVLWKVINTGYTTSSNTDSTQNSNIATLQNQVNNEQGGIGKIVMVYSATLSASFDSSGRGIAGGWVNWALCNGGNGTPNLRGKFIAGYDERGTGGDSDYTNIGNTGGSKTFTLSTLNIPPHRHLAVYVYPDFGGGSSTDSPSALASITSSLTGGSSQQSAASDTADQVHNAGGYGFGFMALNSGDGTNNLSSGQGGLPSSPDSVDSRPPYFVLAYAMKIA